jgi:hypothetical protein
MCCCTTCRNIRININITASNTKNVAPTNALDLRVFIRIPYSPPIPSRVTQTVTNHALDGFSQ